MSGENGSFFPLYFNFSILTTDVQPSLSHPLHHHQTSFKMQFALTTFLFAALASTRVLAAPSSIIPQVSVD